MKQWEAIFSDLDREVLRKSGFGRRQEYGKNPAFMMVDVMISFIGTSRKPILQAIEEFPTSCGEVGWDAVPNLQRLLQASRTAGIPVVHVTGDYEMRRFVSSTAKLHGAGSFALSDPRLYEFIRALAPLPTEIVLRKTKASAFFDTPLAGVLRSLGVDALIIGGSTTSGCVRASVIDACNHGFICLVVEECTFDRFQLSHLVSLWDLNAKYANVISLEEAIRYIGGMGSSKRNANLGK